MGMALEGHRMQYGRLPFATLGLVTAVTVAAEGEKEGWLLGDLPMSAKDIERRRNYRPLVR